MSQASTSRAPLIGITADLSRVPANGSDPAQEPTLFLPQRYCRAIQEVGGIPLILPPIASQSRLRRILQRLDGVVISGGNFDIHPSYYGEKPIRALGAIKKERTEFELELVDLALNQDRPLLGVCGGAQAINVALGGSLYQDIANPASKRHQTRARCKKRPRWSSNNNSFWDAAPADRPKADPGGQHDPPPSRQKSRQGASGQCHGRRWLDRRD